MSVRPNEQSYCIRKKESCGGKDNDENTNLVKSSSNASVHLTPRKFNILGECSSIVAHHSTLTTPPAHAKSCNKAGNHLSTATLATKHYHHHIIIQKKASSQKEGRQAGRQTSKWSKNQSPLLHDARRLVPCRFPRYLVVIVNGPICSTCRFPRTGLRRRRKRSRRSRSCHIASAIAWIASGCCRRWSAIR